MHWNYTPEFVSLLFLCVMVIHTRHQNSSTNLKSLYYIRLIRFSFGAVLLSSITVYFSEHYTLINPSTLFFLVGLFYAVYSFVPYLVYMYTLSILIEHQDKRLKWHARYGLIPYGLFLSFVLINAFHPWLFKVTDLGYSALMGEIAIFMTAYVYFASMLIQIQRHSKTLDKGMRSVLLGYIAIITTSIVIQQMYPSLLLTGVGISIALLNITLYLQYYDSNIDVLTKLPNRNAFMDRLHSLSSHQTPAHLVLLSLKDFKSVNDIYGRRFGNQVLLYVSEVLKNQSMGDLYRFAGDIFAIISLQTKADTLKHIATVSTTFEEPSQVAGITLQILSQVVFVEFNKDVYTHEDAEALLEYFLGQLKSRRSQNFIESTSRSIHDMHRHFQITESLKSAQRDQRFFIELQPIIRTDCSCFKVAEALLRLKDPQLGVISPGEFIPLVENGMMAKIGLHVLDLSMHYLREAHSKGFMISISVNFSATILNDPQLTDKVLSILRNHGIDPTYLHIEVTENVFNQEIEQVRSQLKQLKDHGIQIYMDDFGTGYSNLSRISQFPFDVIKLDRSLVIEGYENRLNNSLLKSMIDTFHTINMKVLAEGIETREQFDFVKSLGVDAVQGFYLCKPLSVMDSFEFYDTLKDQDFYLNLDRNKAAD